MGQQDREKLQRQHTSNTDRGCIISKTELPLGPCLQNQSEITGQRQTVALTSLKGMAWFYMRN